MQRQAVLEQRTAVLGGDITGSIGHVRNAQPAEAAPKASPINDTIIFTAPPDREARLQSRELPATLTHLANSGAAGGLDGVLGRLSAALDRIDQQHTAMLTAMEERADSKARNMRSVLKDLGVDPSKAPAAAVGGPFVPLKVPKAGASAFDRQLYRINFARAQINQLAQTLLAVPVRKPVVGEVDMSSSFGMRMDPFLGRPAVHTGIDLRGDIGEPCAPPPLAR